ncbi:MAG: FtsW/RodA/SpoVE family cell cycle protein [Verrucomicrobiota bacterium]
MTFLLVSIGIVMVYSSSAVLAHDWHGNAQFFLVRQFFYVMLGTIGFFIAAALPLDFYKRHARAFMLLAIMLLMTVYLPIVGHAAGGARRWIHFGAFQFQPVEFAKIACCIYLADYLGRKIAMAKATCRKNGLASTFTELAHFSHLAPPKLVTPSFIATS